jgi:TRAP-type C4-dicarboxylate transport system substrate-binding protein
MFSMRNAIIAASVFAAIGFSAAQAQTVEDFPPGAEKDLVQKTCTVCHVAGQVTSQHKSADQWNETVEKMVGYGAKVDSDADFSAIVTYLTRNYGPASHADAGAAATKR